jgi:hypothetical protein
VIQALEAGIHMDTYASERLWGASHRAVMSTQSLQRAPRS